MVHQGQRDSHFGRSEGTPFGRRGFLTIRCKLAKAIRGLQWLIRSRGKMTRMFPSCLAALWCFGSNFLSAAPVITKFSPESGAAGTSVSLEGSAFTGVSEIRFGEALAIFTVNSSSRIAVTVPLEATTGVITLNGPSGAAVSPKPFQVAPRISSFLPTSASPGASVTVVGLNFDGAESVWFNGTTAEFAVIAPNQLKAEVPAGVASGPISVTTPVGTATSAARFLVTTNQPFLESFSPISGEPNTLVTINGINLSGTTGLWFNGIRATSVPTITTNRIQVVVPAAAASGPITIATSKGTNTSLSDFVVTTAPVITSFLPVAGSPGTEIAVNGTNFAGVTSVKFNGISATSFQATSPIQLRVTIPKGATSGPVEISTPKGTGWSAFSFISGTGPIIVDFSPDLARVGTYVAINGLNFASVRSVKFGNVPAVDYSATAETQILAAVPSGATNGPISVTTTAGTAQSRDDFLVETGKPIITGFDPTAGVPATSVRIAGADLTGARSVKFGGVEAADFKLLTDTIIQASVPGNALTGPISVQTSSGTTTTAAFFIAAPRIASFTPTSGVAGVSVTLRGTNLSEVLSVLLGSTPTVFTNRATNEIIATVPAEAVPATFSVLTRAGIVASVNPFWVSPLIQGFAPTKGPIGTRVTISGTGFYDVRSVTVGGVAASDITINSVREITATVPARAATGPIRVTTGTGASTTTEAFAVGALADLALAYAQSPESVMQNQLFSCTLTVTNEGPSDAAGVVVSNTLPANVLFLSATASHGTVSRAGQNLRLQVPTLAMGGTATLTTALLALQTGRLTNVANVHATEEDPDFANNSIAQLTDVVVNIAVLRMVQTAPEQVRLSWPTTATGFIPEATGVLAPADWKPFNSTPVIVGSESVLYIATQPGPVFFRLRKP